MIIATITRIARIEIPIIIPVSSILFLSLGGCGLFSRASPAWGWRDRKSANDLDSFRASGSDFLKCVADRFEDDLPWLPLRLFANEIVETFDEFVRNVRRVEGKSGLLGGLNEHFCGGQAER